MRLSLEMCVGHLWVLAILLLPWPFAVYAQSVTVGGKLGVNFATQGRGATEQSTKRGLMGGGFVVLMPHRRLTLQAELLYSEKGAVRFFPSVEEDAAGRVAFVETKDRITLPYVEVPIMGRLFLPFAGRSGHGFHLTAGPSFAIQAAGCRRSIERRGWDINTGELLLEESIDLPCGLPKSRDIALVVGGGLDLAVGDRTVVIDGRYTRDLVSISEGSSPKNRIFALSVGLAFGTASR